MMNIVNSFVNISDDIDSRCRALKSNEILEIVAPALKELKYSVETSKKKDDKVRVQILFGNNGKETLSFEADAYSSETKIVIEVEAGRAVTNYQFLKDFFQVCMMIEVEYSIDFCNGIKQMSKLKAKAIWKVKEKLEEHQIFIS